MRCRCQFYAFQFILFLINNWRIEEENYGDFRRAKSKTLFCYCHIMCMLASFVFYQLCFKDFSYYRCFFCKALVLFLFFNEKIDFIETIRLTFEHGLEFDWQKWINTVLALFEYTRCHALNCHSDDNDSVFEFQHNSSNEIYLYFKQYFLLTSLVKCEKIF